MAKIAQYFKDKAKTIKDYPKTLIKAVYGDDGKRLDNIISDITSDIDSTKAKIGTTDISKYGDGTVTGAVKSACDKADANEVATADVNSKLGNTDISAIGDGTMTGGLNALNSNLNAKFVWTILSNAQTDAWGNLHIDKLEKYIPISVVAFSEYIGMLYQKSSYEWFIHFMTDNQNHTIASNFTFANVMVLWVRDPNYL